MLKHQLCDEPLIGIASWSSCFDRMPPPNVEMHKKTAKLTCPPYVMPIVRTGSTSEQQCHIRPPMPVLNQSEISNWGSCYSSCLDILVRNQFSSLSRYKQIDSRANPVTQPSWIFFEESSADCFKVIGNKVWYFVGGIGPGEQSSCSRKTVLHRAEKHR